MRSTVRSEKAPHSGLSTTETAAPTRVTSESADALWSGLITSACWASSTWIGPKNPDQTPIRDQREPQHPHGADRPDRLGQRGQVGRAGRLPGERDAHPWRRIISAYQSKERFGVRTRVS